MNCSYEKSWFIKMLSNGFGAFCTAIVMLVFTVTKFRDGAWVVLILTPVLISIFLWIHRHYANVATSLSLEKYGEPPPYNIRHRVAGAHQQCPSGNAGCPALRAHAIG